MEFKDKFIRLNKFKTTSPYNIFQLLMNIFFLKYNNKKVIISIAVIQQGSWLNFKLKPMV